MALTNARLRLAFLPPREARGAPSRRAVRERQPGPQSSEQDSGMSTSLTSPPSRLRLETRGDLRFALGSIASQSLAKRTPGPPYGRGLGYDPSAVRCGRESASGLDWTSRAFQRAKTAG